MNTGYENMQIGLQKATDFADRKDPAFNQRAYQFFLRSIRKRKRFMVEDVRNAAAKAGIVAPGSLRVWGGIALRAKHAGIIRKLYNKSVKNANANCANAGVWEVC